MRKSRTSLVAAIAVALLAVPATGVAQAQNSSPATPRYQPQMVAALADSLHVSEKAAADRLDHQAAQEDQLANVVKEGKARTDGAFFDASGNLVVNAPDDRAASQIEKAGLHARVPEHGKAALTSAKEQLDEQAAEKAPAGISSWSVDLSADTVKVEVNDADARGARSFLKTARSFGDAVHVVKGAEPLESQATVYPGSAMTWTDDKGSWVCSVGFGAQDSSGKGYLVSAGHCLASLPDLSVDGDHFAKGTDSRYEVGRDSVDMGIAAVDQGDSIATEVGTWGSTDGNVAVEGSERAPEGADLCKSGQTTGWTCGKVEAYDVSVTYVDEHGGPDTVVSGLGESTVCTEGGDSGGAYISGNQGQGMTSGGPTNQSCGGLNSSTKSYFQPLDDTLEHYGLTLNTH
ncbi:S1 family peptidase [Streptomyces tubbatahanensis]|uniref:S1 family peptidase n=1 Tax=Streptomyces tubbatahanensis TaxID=2923272 RepID=A0ABY3Y0N2_9ACTN|nr:S1 family peptidase [Streptomyces tubbatahanensis]UNT00139.1 S1 family peptidase [Streptomyces tubbatahanensis]